MSEAAIEKVLHDWLADYWSHVPPLGKISKALALAAQQDGEWQPIETAPRDGTTILGYWPVGEWHTGEIGDDGKWYPAWDHPEAEDWAMPTHWMPLPAGPEQGAGQ